MLAIDLDVHEARETESGEMSIGIVLSPDFTLSSLAVFVDAFRLAADPLHGRLLTNFQDNNLKRLCRFTFLSFDLNDCTSSCGLRVRPTETYGDPAKFDLIVVVGGRLMAQDQLATQTYKYLRAVGETGRQIVGLCTGSFILAEAGLMAGKRCCIHFSVLPEFVARYPDSIPVIDENFVVAENYLTTPGSTGSIDVAAYLIAQQFSHLHAKKVLSHFYVDSNRTGQFLPKRPYDDLMVNARKTTVDAVKLMEFNIERPFPIKTLAKEVNVSTDTLNRLFIDDLGKTPAKFWRAMRLWHARLLVLNTNKQITQIAYETGFSDASHFCKSFKREYRCLPFDLRRNSTSSQVPSDASDGHKKQPR